MDECMQLTSGNLIILVSVSVALHTLHQEIAEHTVLSFLKGVWRSGHQLLLSSQ